MIAALLAAASFLGCPIFPATNAWNQAPRARKNVTGDVDELVAAAGLSLPRGESPTPQTTFRLLSRSSTS